MPGRGNNVSSGIMAEARAGVNGCAGGAVLTDPVSWVKAPERASPVDPA
jgi:hypothetical protein